MDVINEEDTPLIERKVCIGKRLTEIQYVSNDSEIIEKYFTNVNKEHRSMTTCSNVIIWLTTILLCISAFIQSMASQGISGMISVHLEKRYGYSSIYSGLILTGNDVTAFLLNPIIGYYAGRGKRLRWIGVGSFIIAIGCFLYSLPHFITGMYVPMDASDLEPKLCGDANILECPKSVLGITHESKYWPFFIFLASQVVMGIGSIPLNVLGSTYIDDHFSRNIRSYVMGCWYLAWYIGPVTGLLVATVFLRFWIDFPNPASVPILDPEWLGAWWLPYIASGILLVILSILIPLFPDNPKKPFIENIKHIKFNDMQDEESAHDNVKSLLIKDNYQSERFSPSSNSSFFGSIIEVMKCSVFTFSVFGLVTKMFIVSGQAAFLSKLLSVIFDRQPSETGFTLIFIIGIPAISGIFLGSKFVHIFEKKNTMHYLLILCSVASFYVAIHGMTYMAPIGCENQIIHGLNINGSNALEEGCNSHCDCSDYFNPICGDDGKTYISPCSAGCEKSYKTDHGYRFEKCSCILVKSKRNAQSISGASSGFCPRKCKSYNTFLISMAVFSFFAFFGAVPQGMIPLRYVSPQHKALAFSLQGSFVKLFCLIPAPIAFGKFIDITCFSWLNSVHYHKDAGCLIIKNKACHSYNIDSLKNIFSIVSFVCGLTSTVFYIFAFIKARKQKLVFI